MTEVTDTQKKRAVNIIWGAARDYSFTPDFKAYDADGNAELYWNCIIGAVRRQYEYSKLETVFRSFKDLEDSDLYESLLWLGLENCVFAKESPERPALAYLRRAYAEKVVAAYSPETSGDLGEAMAWAHFSRVLGREPKLDKYSIKLLDELEFTPDMTTDEIVTRTGDLFSRWFQISTAERKKQKKRPSPCPSFSGKKRAARAKSATADFCWASPTIPKTSTAELGSGRAVRPAARPDQNDRRGAARVHGEQIRQGPSTPRSRPPTSSAPFAPAITPAATCTSPGASL
jgi:hypothetical protein